MENLPELRLRPDLLDTVRYAAAMWEFQLLHFDHERARAEGLERAIVQGPLMGTYLARVLAGAETADTGEADVWIRNGDGTTVVTGSARVRS